MNAVETYSLLKSEIGPWFKSQGFKRSKGLLGWYSPHGGIETVVWCQVSREGWDHHAGSKFTVELQRSAEPLVGASPAQRERFVRLLTCDDLEEIRSIQNAVIDGLCCPGLGHPTLQISASVAEWYLKKFEKIREPYSSGEDIWFRYASPEHVTLWARFIARKLPKCVALVEEWPRSW